MITLNFEGIIEIFKNTKIFGSDYKSWELKRRKNFIWNKTLKMKDKVFHQKHFTFFNQLQTDGISATLLFIRTKHTDKKWGQRISNEEHESIQKLQDLNKEECENIVGNLVGVDPGKNKLLTMTDGKIFYKYTNKRRWNDCYFKRSNEILLTEKKKYNIIEANMYSGKSQDLNTYIKYLEEKVKTNEKFYQNPLFRKLKLRRFIRTKQAENKMLQEITDKFGNDCVIGLGNWSINTSHQMKRCAPSITKGIGKLLSTRFRVLEIDEYKTSKIYNRDTSKNLVNLKINGNSIHGLLTLQGTPKSVIVNRDCNAAKNILNIFTQWIRTQTRPIVFERKHWS